MPTDADFVWIPGQTATLGSDTHYPEEAPARPVAIDGFWIQTRQVTNDEFGAFVEATGYLTVAERPLDPADYPDAPPENLESGSMVFHRTSGPVDLRHLSQWWTWTPGASWRKDFISRLMPCPLLADPMKHSITAFSRSALAAMA